MRMRKVACHSISEDLVSVIHTEPACTIKNYFINIMIISEKNTEKLYRVRKIKIHCLESFTPPRWVDVLYSISVTPV